MHPSARTPSRAGSFRPTGRALSRNVPPRKITAAYAKAYDIQTSDDGQNRTTVRAVTDGNGDVDDLDVSGTGRYVRVQGTRRGTGHGYPLYEFGVHS